MRLVLVRCRLPSLDLGVVSGRILFSFFVSG
jgi:hypothetical protein